MQCLCLHQVSRPSLLFSPDDTSQLCWNAMRIKGLRAFQKLKRGSLLREKVRPIGQKGCVSYITANGQVEEPEEGDEKTGDKKVQEILVEMVRLQSGKLRVSEFVDERSKLLSDIAEQAKQEYGKIAEDAKRNIDEASSKVLKNVEADAQAFEDELASARAEIEANERDLDEFEKNVEKARNEGLFFKGLYSKPFKPWKERTPEEQQFIKEQAEIVSKVAQKTAVSQSRRFLYLVLILLLSLTVLESVSSGNIQWPKLATYSGILVALIFRLSYEKFVASNGDPLNKR